MEKEDIAIWEISIYILWSRVELCLLLTQMLKTQIRSLQKHKASKAQFIKVLLPVA